MNKGGRYGKYGEQKRRERFKVKHLTPSAYLEKQHPPEKWRKKKEK